MRRAALLLGLPVLLAAQVSKEVRRFDVTVVPPDMVFRFGPRVEVPGMPRVSVVFSGGGARGIAHIGVLQRLEEMGFPLDSVAGTSAGAVVGALFASGFSGREIEDLFRARDLSRAFMEPLLRAPGETLEEQEDREATYLSLEFSKGRMGFAQGLRSGAEMQHVLQGLLARGAYFSGGDFDRLRRPLRVLATNLETGEGRVFGKGDLVESVRASMAIPGGFRPVVIEGQQYVDGALVENLPVFTAKEAFHPDLVIAVDISAPLENRPSSNFFSVAARSLDLVVERRQWESRAAADFLIRPVIRDAPALDYRSRLPELIQVGREAYDARRKDLGLLLRSRLGGNERLLVSRVEVDSPEAPVPATQPFLDLLKVQPEGPLVQDVHIALQQILVHGLAREAWATLDDTDGGRVLRIHLRPYSRVTMVDVVAPEPWRARTLAALTPTVPFGEPFNPEAFGRVMGQLVYRFLMEGSPLVDARGSGFDSESGRVIVVLKEPIVTRLEVRPTDGGFIDENQLRGIVGTLEGKPLRTEDLQKRMALAEHRLSLAEVRYQTHPEGENGLKLTLVPVPQQGRKLDLSLGYETTLGGQFGATYRSQNPSFGGTELDISAARNRLQEEAAVDVRRPFGFAPGTGVELSASYWQLRLDSPLTWLTPELPGDSLEARISASDLTLRTYIRFGNLDTGKLSLDVSRRDAAYRQDGGRRTREENAVFLSTEWDNLDRHTMPRDGLMLRARYGIGRSEGGILSGGSFRQAYVRARGLTSLNEFMGLDLDLEWGYGKALPLDRWWVLGGPSFVIGSRSLGYLAPNFAAARFTVPFRLYAGLGLTLEVAPRFDFARLSQEPFQLLGGSDSPRAQGAGLMMRTNLSNFYVELSYGFLKVSTATDPGRTIGSFNVLVGTQPFDLWKRR